MESLNFITVLKVIGDFGTLGLVIFLWWQDSRRYSDLLTQYKADMDEQREMYEKNVSLVKDYHSVASDLREVVMMSTQALTRVADDIRQNQYCPMVRIDKKRVTIGERHDNLSREGRHERETGGSGT